MKANKGSTDYVTHIKLLYFHHKVQYYKQTPSLHTHIHITQRCSLKSDLPPHLAVFGTGPTFVD